MARTIPTESGNIEIDKREIMWSDGRMAIITYAYVWVGPDTARVSWELIDASTDIVNHYDGTLKIGPFRARIIDLDIERGAFIVQRIADA